MITPSRSKWIDRGRSLPTVKHLKGVTSDITVLRLVLHKFGEIVCGRGPWRAARAAVRWHFRGSIDVATDWVRVFVRIHAAYRRKVLGYLQLRPSIPCRRGGANMRWKYSTLSVRWGKPNYVRLSRYPSFRSFTKLDALKKCSILLSDCTSLDIYKSTEFRGLSMRQP